MSNFPEIQKDGPFQQITVPLDSDIYPKHFMVFQGVGEGFHPAGLPAPDWFVAVNPAGFDDAEEEDVDLNECFEIFNTDVMMALVAFGDLEQAQEELWARAMADATDHVACDSGGAYAVWKLADGNLLVAGFDNGGSDNAQSAALEAAAALGNISMTAAASHYNPEVILDPENPQGIQRLIDMASITRQLIGDRTSKSPSAKP